MWLQTSDLVKLTIIDSLGHFSDDDLEINVLLVKSFQFGLHVVYQSLLTVGDFTSILPCDHLSVGHGIDLFKTDAWVSL